MATIHASADGIPVLYRGARTATLPLQAAIDRAAPGDVIELHPGRYETPVVIANGGTRDAPITLRGPDDLSAVLDGRQRPESAREQFMPTETDFAFAKVMSADAIRFEKIAFENCWPCAVFIGGAKDVAITDCRILGGRFAVYARNHSPERKTRRVTLRRVTWIQDVDHDLWDGRTTWLDVKQEQPTDNDARYFNGALFGSYDIKGPVTICHCDVSHAFNAIRLDAKRRADNRGRNCDIRIIGNRFSFIRDNAIEPEKVAERMWVVDNVFFNVHAVFSLDGVAGECWYYIGNRLLNNRKPGKSGQENRGGKIFKFHSKEPFPRRDFYFLFNSIQTRTAYCKKGQTRHWTHKNNAIGICRDGPDCDPDRRMFGHRLKWHDTYSFENDLCDHPDFPAQLIEQGFAVSGRHADGGTFAPPTADVAATRPAAAWTGELDLAQGSPGRGASCPVSVDFPDGRRIHVPGGHDIGAPAPRVLRDAVREINVGS